jgi:hypothetical protein
MSEMLAGFTEVIASMHTKIPQTSEISSAVGTTWKTIEVRRKLMP